MAGPLVRLACERHLKDRELAAQPSKHPRGWWFDEGAADFVIQYFETVLRLPDMKDEETGEHLPFLLQPAQDFIAGSIFGWKGADSYRRFREGYIEMGKGNGKTPLFAGFGLYGMTEDEEQAAEIYAAASTKEQAKVLFRDAERIVDASPELRARLRCTVNNIADPETDSFFRPFSRDEGTRSGPRPHIGLIDELHEASSPEITLKVRAGAKRRKQPFFGEITNSGFDRTSICWQRHEHSRLVLQGQLQDDRFFAYVCSLDEGDDPLKDPSCWIKTNPLLGVSVTREYLERQVQNANNISAETNTVLRLNFCVWTAQNVRLIHADKWAACSQFIPDAALEGVPCYGGIDLGQTDDFSAWVLIWLLDDGRIAVRPKFWIPASAKEAYPQRPYDQWERAGLLNVTEGNITDYNVVQDAIAEDCERWGVIEVAYDKRFAQQMALNLQGEGVTMVDTPQGFQLTEPINKLLEVVKAQKLAHGGDAILSWMAGNVEGKHGRDKQIRIDKEASIDKIDGISALVMAISRWIAAKPDDEQSSHYDSRGVLVI